MLFILESMENVSILVWNVCGLNDPDKWLAIRNMIDESSCSVVCIQETKQNHFDMA